MGHREPSIPTLRVREMIQGTDITVLAFVFVIPSSILHELVHMAFAKWRNVYHGFAVGLSTMTGLDVSPAFAVVLKKFDGMTTLAPLIVLTPVAVLGMYLSISMGNIVVATFFASCFVVNTVGSAGDIVTYVLNVGGKRYTLGFAGYVYSNGEVMKVVNWKNINKR